jgi:hypothetical protein
MHLLLDTSPLECRLQLAMGQFVPPISLSEPLPAILWFSSRALAAPRLHSAAIFNVPHGFLPGLFGGGIVSSKDEMKRQTC